MIVGVGVDIVDVPRFKTVLQRTPALRERLFAPSERDLALRSLAARFAAKEALIKAVGDSEGFRWHDVEIVQNEHGRPSFRLSGVSAEKVREHGISLLHLSLSHDGDSACAFVVAEGVGEAAAASADEPLSGESPVGSEPLVNSDAPVVAEVPDERGAA